MNIYSKKNILLIFLLIALLFGSIVYSYIYLQKEIKQKHKNTSIIAHTVCLEENEYADYEVEKNPVGGGIVKIFIKDKNSNQEKFSFHIEISDSEHYHPLEIHKCGVYAIRTFGYDYQKKMPLENYKRELWRYKYNGEGIPLISDSAKWSYENILGDFRIDPTETLVVLERSYFDNPDYALVVKSLNTKKDVFVLPLKEIVDKYPELEGSIGFNEWTKDGRYFWGNIFDRADVLTFLRIERDTWKYEIFEAPAGTMGGDALNPELGYVTYDDGPPWTGDLDFAKIYQEEWEKEGKIVSFYLYNLFTKEERVLATTTDTMWYFKPKWISDSELEYYLPSGERKVFRVE